MKSLRLALLKLRREWRAGEHLILVLALTVAATALTAVSFFTSRVERAMVQRANEVLAADLRLESSRPLSETYLSTAAVRSLRTAQVQSFPSVVVLGEASSLSRIGAVSPGYPLRGRMKIADSVEGTARETTTLPQPGEAWLDPRLLVRLNARVGDRLQVGNRQLKITQVLTYRPDQGSQFVDLAPTALIRLEDLQSTGLVGVGSRVQYVQLFAGPRQSIAEFNAWLRAHRQFGERIEELGDASPQIESSIQRAARFLNLSALASVLLAGVAVAMAARRYAARHLDTVALMKSMGAAQALVLAICVLELGALGLIAGVSGTLFGFVAQAGLAYFARGFLNTEIPLPGWEPAILGIITPIVILCGFALPPLLQLKRVPPARVLRHNVEAPRLRYLTVYGIAAAAVIGLLLAMVRDVRLVTYVAGGTLATMLVLAVAGGLLVKVLGRLRRVVGVSWRYGVANIARRGRESIAQLVAFGMGLMVMLLLLVVREDLLRDWRMSLPADAPNQFLINIQPDQAAALTQFFAERGVAPPELVPMMRARLVSVNDTPIQQLRADGDRARGFLQREANLTWASTLQEGNKIVAGRWWQAGDDGGARVSVEAEMAATLGLKLGDTVTYRIDGEDVTATVTSLREVRWDSFRPNFFMVFSPGVLDRHVGTYITSVHLTPSQRPIMGEFYRTFPEVTAIDIDVLLAQIRSVMDNATLAIQYVFAFSLLAGVTVLLAAVQATRDERRYESAMLRTLGASRRVVLRSVVAEFVTLGLLAGLLGAFGASAIGYVLATEVFNLKFTLNPVVWGVGMLGGMLLVGVTGIAVTRSVVNHPPMASLRET